MGFKAGDRIRHRFNRELGPGVVRSIAGRTLVAHFPESDTSLELARDSDAIERLRFAVGGRALLVDSREAVVVGEHRPDGAVVLADGREVHESRLWPLETAQPLVERLARGEVDPFAAFSLRLDALHLAAIREAGGLGSFLGGRIRLYPHQLHVAERATRADPVRWLLADEVGLGKTVEACLVLDHLLRTRRADRTLVVAPDTLTIQWLGELWRKYHQVFVLIDEPRLADVERVFGHGFNPFEAHRRAVIGLGFLEERPWLTVAAVEAGIDLLVVDEAHHLRRPAGHPGNPAYRAVQPIAALGHHMLLLTATPLEDDAFGFLRLVQLLRPDELPEGEPLEERLRSGAPLPPCTSATRRADIGGLPPRRPVAVDLGAEPWEGSEEAEEGIRRMPAADPLALRRKRERLERALARPADAGDPRLEWLCRQAERWRESGDKTLVFAAERETLETIRETIGRCVPMRTAVFHEDLSPAQRDIEVAQFRLPSGPSLLVSTECGGEGRNFEFCTRLVLFDLPWNPVAVEQRIGRLDRIGRRLPVEIVYFRPRSPLGRAVVDVYEELGLFRRPMAGLERELSQVEAAIEEFAIRGDAAPFSGILRNVEEAYDRVTAAALRELHRDPYRPELAERILARVPADLAELTRGVVLEFAELADFHVERLRGHARFSIELAHRSLVAGLPGVPPGSSFLGTFDREEAVQDESSDFFAAGHALVEGVLAEIEDGPVGRVGLLHFDRREWEGGLGLVAIYKDGAHFETVALDSQGRSRPEWAARFRERPLRSRRVPAEHWTAQPGWGDLVRRLAARLDERAPVALAFVRVD